MIYLSICIPTYQRIEITRNTIASIYADSDGVDLDEFEVVVSDNDKQESSRIFEQEFLYKNFRYFQTNCEGFLNSFHVLGYGKGLFLKLHNNYTMLRKGTLKYLIEQIKLYQDKHPGIFYTNSLLGMSTKLEFGSFDRYMQKLSYFSSWSTGFGIWKLDYDCLKKSVQINRMFPQTTLFLAGANKNLFVLDDQRLFDDQKIPKKGGYNPYKVFGVEYLDLLNEKVLSGNISSSTFKKIRRDLLSKYLATRFFKTVILRMDSFEYSDIRSYLSKYYGRMGFLKLYFYVWLSPLRMGLNKIFSKLNWSGFSDRKNRFLN